MTPHSLRKITPALEIRPFTPADAEGCGRIMYLAFRRVAESRGFPPDFPTVRAATDLAGMLASDPSTFGMVATAGGAVIGSNFLSEGDPIRGVGPITVDPDYQDSGIGRRLMQAVIGRGATADGIRLVQAAYNTVSISLYASLGFEVREPLMLMVGHPRGELPLRSSLRALRAEDLAAANALCERVTGFPRSTDAARAARGGTAVVLERDGRLVGYMTTPYCWITNHAVAETDDDIKALVLGAATAGRPLSFLMPIRRAELFRWALGIGLRVVQPMTLMSRGAYSEPAGGYLPSVIY